MLALQPECVDTNAIAPDGIQNESKWLQHSMLAGQPYFLVNDFHAAYEDFLILTYLWAPAWAAVVLLSFFAFEGRVRPGVAVAAWFAGTLASLAFVNYDNLFGNIVASPAFWNDGLISGLHGADLSGAVSVVVAALSYLIMRRVRAT